MIPQRFAYLIIAHHQFDLLARLIQLLDDERNDIYLHIDQKAVGFDQSFFARLPIRSNIYFVENRIDVGWADYTVVRSELSLFEMAAQRGGYAYYHLISGVDLPLVTQDEMHAFFAQHAGMEFISGSDQGWQVDRVEKIHLFRLRQIKDSSFKFLYRWIRHGFLGLQKLVRYNRVNGRLGALYKGTNWVSLTEPCVRYLLQKMQSDIVYYQYSHCGDEIYKQTAIYNSTFAASVYVPRRGEPIHLRYIDWDRGAPYVFRKEDYRLLFNSGCLFARKFDMNVDRDIIDMITAHLSSTKPQVNSYDD